MKDSLQVAHPVLGYQEFRARNFGTGIAEVQATPGSFFFTENLPDEAQNTDR